MASRSFVGYGEFGFWVINEQLDLFYRLLALHIDEPAPEDVNSEAYIIRNILLLESKLGFQNFAPSGFEEVAPTESAKAIVIFAVTSLLEALNKIAKIDGPTLNLLGMSDEFVGELNPKTYIEIGNAFIDLLKGRIKTTKNDGLCIPSY